MTTANINTTQQDNSMKSDAVGFVVWHTIWKGCLLLVSSTPSGFRSVVRAPWEPEAAASKSIRPSVAKAKARCWGMLKHKCELLASEADKFMHECTTDDDDHG